MGIKLNSKELKLYKKIDEILYFEWNPIGVSELPRDEYYSYIPKIFDLKKSGANAEEIAKALCDFETHIIGMPADAEKCIAIGKKIESI